MADDEVTEGAGEVSGKGSSSSPLKLILIVFALLLVLGGAGVFVFLKFIVPAIGGGGENVAEVKQEVVIQRDEDGVGVMYALDSFVVNLAASGGRRFLKVTIELELSSEELKQELGKRKSQIKDTVITILSSKSFDEVYSVSGKMIVRTELMGRLNSLLQKGKVMNIYFTEFVIQ